MLTTTLVLSFVCLHVVLGGSFKKNRPLPFGSSSPYSAAEGYTVYNKPKGLYKSSYPYTAECSHVAYTMGRVTGTMGWGEFGPPNDCNCDPCSPDYDWCDYMMEEVTGGTWRYQTNIGVINVCETQWTGSAWTCDWQCPGIIGEKMMAFSFLTQAMGRRRLTDADEAVCHAITEHAVQLETFAKILRDVQDGVDVEADEKKLGEEIWGWCDEKVSSDRRRASDAYGDLSGRLERYRKTSHADWTNFRQHVTNLTGEQRRLQDPIQEARRRSTALPADIWYQCRGYAYAVVQMIASYTDEAANVFVMKANSDNPEHRQEACASIVNHVNAAVEAEKIPDIELIDETTKGATEVVATYGELAVTRSEDVGVALGLQKLEVVFAGVATTVYAMFAICKSYASYEALDILV